MQFKDQSMRYVFEIMPAISHTFFKPYLDKINMDGDLTISELRSIMILLFNDELPMSSVSAKVDLEKGSFTSVAKKLIKRGYIVKIPSQKDGRISILKLTDMGKEFAIKNRKEHIEFMKEQLNVLSEEKGKMLLNSAEVMYDLLMELQEKKNRNK